jgi:hypothetical protein
MFVMFGWRIDIWCILLFFCLVKTQVDSGAGPSGTLAVSMTWEKGDIGILPLLFPSLPH